MYGAGAPAATIAAERSCLMEDVLAEANGAHRVFRCPRDSRVMSGGLPDEKIASAERRREIQISPL